MTKTSKRFIAAVVIVFLAYNAIAFVIPFVKNGVFWLSYVFTLIAIASQIYVFKSAFSKETSVKSKFYGFPVAQIGVAYLLIQFAAGVVFMALASFVPAWIPGLVFVLLLAAAAIGYIAADAMRDEIERQDKTLKKDVSCMRALQSQIAYLEGQCTDESSRALIKKLAEEFRFSDPVSSSELADIEAELMGQTDTLAQHIGDEDLEFVEGVCKKLSSTLKERNRLCKLNK